MVLGRRKGFYRAARMAIFAILFQALLPLFHHSAEAASLPGIHICAAHIAAQAEPGKAPVAKPQCPICFGLHLLGGGYVPPEAAPSVVVESKADGIVFHAEDFIAGTVVWPGIGPRAPPVLA